MCLSFCPQRGVGFPTYITGHMAKGICIKEAEEVSIRGEGVYIKGEGRLHPEGRGFAYGVYLCSYVFRIFVLPLAA